MRKKRRREDLIALVPKLVENVLRNDSRLPVTVTEAWVFGSVARGQEEVHDLDIVLLYEVSERQQEDWSWFSSIFGDLRYQKEELEEVARNWKKKIRRTLYRHRNDCYSLKDALKKHDVIRLAEKARLNLDWAECFSWSHLKKGNIGVLFFPAVDTPLRKYVVGWLAQKGLSVQFQLKSNFGKEGRLGLVKNYKKIWDRATPIEEILRNFRATEEEERAFLERDLSDLSEQLKVVADELEQKKQRVSQNLPSRLKLKLDRITEFPVSTVSQQNDLDTLRDRCQETRDVLRLARKNSVFLDILDWRIDHIGRGGALFLVERILNRTPNDELTELEIRHFLRKMELPEQRFMVCQSRGIRIVIRDPSKRKRQLLSEQEVLTEGAGRIESRIRALLPMRRRWRIYVELLRDGGKIAVKSLWRKSVDTVGTKARLHMTYYSTRGEFRRRKANLASQGWSSSKEWNGTIEISRTIHLDIRDDWKNIKGKVLTVISPLATSPTRPRIGED